MYKKKLKTADAVADASVTPRSHSSKKYFSTAKIAYLAMFVAINVVVGAFSPRIGSLKITFTYLLCFLAGNFYGAIAGGIVGGLGDLLGCLIGGYAPNPIILLCSVMLGVIPGLVRLIKIKKLGKFLPYLHIVVAFILDYVICTMFLNTYGLYVLGLAKGASFWVYMVTIRMPTQTPIVAINLALALCSYPLFERIFKKPIEEKSIEENPVEVTEDKNDTSKN